MKKVIYSIILCCALTTCVASANSLTDAVSSACVDLKNNIKNNKEAWIVGGIAGVVVGTTVALSLDYAIRKEHSLLGRLFAKKKPVNPEENK
jgi:hypothetical protein